MEQNISLLYPGKLYCEYLENPLGVDTAVPRFNWKLRAEGRGVKQTAYQIVVSSSEELLNKDNGDYWDSGIIYSDQSNQVAYKGKELKSQALYFWKVKCWNAKGIPGTFSETAFFSMGLLKEEDWKAEWISADETISSPLIRKTFHIEKKVKRASVFISGLGYYEMHINGQKVGDHVLDPNWTDFDKREIKGLLYPFDDKTKKRVHYVTYDVTKMLAEGGNAIGVMLGNGWYNQRERNVEGEMGYGIPRLLLQLEVEFEDGSSTRIISNEGWKYSSGPILFNNIFYGERYDARLEKEGWTEAEYDDRSWQRVKLVKKTAGILRSQMSPPDKIAEIIHPVRLLNPKPGVFIYDMGQNFSGWARLKVQGRSGSKVVLRFSEEIKADGTLDYDSAGGEGQIQTDTYILKGIGLEVYEPRFTWHGFRYVEITGFPGEPSLQNIEGVFVHADVANSGSFRCSNELFNKIQSNYRWSQLSNLHGGVPSDCPHRERLGYTGDGQITAESAIFNFDMASFYTKWINDIRDAQNEISGFVPHTAPFYGGGGGPAWGSAYVILPWFMHMYYHDNRILEEHYFSMKQWVDYLESRTEGNYIVMKEEPGSWCLGDWCVQGKMVLPEKVVNTFYLGYCAKLLSQIAEVLGITEDALKYGSLNSAVKEAFHKEFYCKEQGCYSVGVQGANIFALALKCVPKEEEDKVLQNIVDTLQNKNNNHLDTGILGTVFLFDTLVEYGYADLAYDLLNQKSFPSYGYMIENGATTLWETWNGEGSHNHPMFGSVSAWFFKRLGGINALPLEPGFKKIMIKPEFMEEISFVETEVDTLLGEITVKWRKEGEHIYLNVDLPVNCRAEIYIPKECCRQSVIFERGTVIWQEGKLVNMLSGILNSCEEKSYIVIEVGSGNYQFSV